MRTHENNFAFIDSQNLNLAIRSLGWKIDHYRFCAYLKEKYGVSKAFLFLGYVETNQSLYSVLNKAGFICVFKPTIANHDGVVKGNCDAELVLQAMIEYENYDKAVIVTGDGDFHCLVKYLFENNKLKKILVPNFFKYSALLKERRFRKYTAFMNDLQVRLEYEKKSPHKDGTL